MRAVHSVNSLRADHGGPSRSVTALCTALSARGEEVEIVTHRQSDGEEEPVMPKASVAVRFVERQPGHRVFLPGRNGFSDAVAHAASVAPSVIHDHGLWLPSNHAAAQAARRTRQPLVTSIRGMMSRWSMDQSKLKKKVAWALYQRRDMKSAAAFHATSEEEAEDVRRLGLRQPIALIPNGVDIPEECADRTQSEGPRQALFMSRLHPKKGLLNLVQAWSQVRPKGWRLVIAGPDADGHRADVERAVREADLDDVRFVGSVADDEKWEHYLRSDLFVLPTFSENFGIVAAEALAAGVPVITTKGAPWQELETRACGWWTDIGAEPVAHALAEAVRLAPEERREMGRRGRALIEERYAWAHVAEEMGGVYAWLLGQGDRPECIV